MASVLDDSQWISGTVLEPPSIQSKIPVVLDPLTTNHYRLLIGDIQKVQPVEDSLNLFRLGPRWITHVDIYGTIRRLEPREKSYTAEVEDGTGTITCTIWRKTPFALLEGFRGDTPSPTVSFVRRLIELSDLKTPAACRSECKDPSLRLGSTVNLRGRLNLFREKITISAYYCRLVTEPQELLDSISHARRLVCQVYSRPYDPAEVGEHLKAAHSTLSCAEVAEKVRDIIESDCFFTFTPLDLQLCPKITELLSGALHPLHEELDYGLEEPDFGALTSPPFDTDTALRPRSSAELKRRVNAVVDQLKLSGLIYPTNENIGGLVTYRYTLCDPVVVQHVYQAIAETTKRINANPDASHDVHRLGAPFALILTKVRASGVDRRYAGLSKAALKRILEGLVQDSLLYQVTEDSYRLV
ncbi:CST complex subunit STN1 [Sparganum proliferum]